MPSKARKKSASAKKAIEVVDTVQYVIEKISDSKIENKTILYKVEWEGYPREEDTMEAEWRMNCDEKLIDFANETLGIAAYIDKIPQMLAEVPLMRDNEQVIRRVLDPLTILAQTTVQCGSVKFVFQDTVGAKHMFLEHIQASNQLHLFNSAFIPPEIEIEKGSKRYDRELQCRMNIFSDYPIVKLVYPFEFPQAFYSPPPLSQLLFEPITLEMLADPDKLEHLVVPQSDDVGFNHSKVFIDSSYLKYGEKNAKYEKHSVDGKERLYCGMERKEYPDLPRFQVSFELVQHSGSGWVLEASCDVPEETPLLMITGVISPVQTAHEALVQFGERVAFSSFIEIPNTNKCLDRRQFHEFSRYIPHNCHPTCSVRLVDSGNEYPDLVVYSLIPINESNNHEISLDYYDGFNNDVATYFKKRKYPDGKIFSLYERNMDFVQCQCGMEGCRQVLYIDQSKRATQTATSKADKLKSLPPSFEFRGLAISEPDIIWKIEDGQFVN